MPILGIIASSLPAAAGDFESIATVTVGSGGSSSITFSSIPSTYSHLQVRSLQKSTYNDGGTDSVYLFLTYNGDSSASSYYSHWLYGEGANAAAAAYNVHNGIIMHMVPKTTSSLNNMFSVSIIDVLDYANTNKYKTTRSLTGGDLNNTYGIIGLESGLYKSTSAISSLTLTPSGGNFAQYSHFALYGIKGA